MSGPFPKPAPTFDDPLAMLRACHERILAQCGTLRQLVGHTRQHGADAAAREAAAQVVRYFSTAGRHHHEDEEQDLFPALRVADPASNAVIDRLQEDHASMERAWTELEAILTGDVGELPVHAKKVEAFASLYTRHITLENEELLPRAEKIVTLEQRAALGASMARRRGVTP